MNTDLEPPTVPAMTPDQHDRLRRQLLQKTRPAVRRTPAWAAPLVAVGAVAAIVAGTIAVVQHPQGEQAPVAGTSSKDPKSDKQPASPVPPQSDKILPFPTAVDLGPVSAADAAAAAKSCNVPGADGALQVLWSRRLKGPKPGSSFVQLVVARAKSPKGQVFAVCQQGLGVHVIPNQDWIKAATSTQAVAAVIGSSWSTQPTKMYFQRWTLYRAEPNVARIESRYVWRGGASAWITGAVADHFAYTDSRAIPVGPNSGTPTEQVRAFDAQGRPVPFKP
ncbi:hypothetical protein E1263_18360 [Kribbella antibiotica]|uniref:Uncharacterized protein n=1 Tax=Kribbella antibiotica TaxID=190195 RepID=A0A4R4ZIW8_9ACTN|nr:hypothetical protein [Kribbella antibiotica]TDD58671.1 hypothetical protein E1263_18360 [Kribbella antibiotica]